MQAQTVDIGTTVVNTTLIGQGVSEDEANSIANECLSGAAYIASKQSLRPKMLTVSVLNFSSEESAKQYLELSEKIEKSAEAQVNASLNASYKVIKNQTMEMDGFDFVRYRYVDNTTNGVVTTTISAEGLIGSIYVGVGLVNMQEKITEDKILEVMTTLNRERLKML